MSERRSPFAALTMAVVAVGMAVSGFFVPTEAGSGEILSEIPWLSHLLAILCLALVAVSLQYVNSNSYLFSSDGQMLFLPYLLAVLSLPCSISLSVYHVSALLMVWSMLFAVRYVNAETLRFDLVFAAIFLSGCASLMVPPLLYMEAFIFLYCLFRRGQDLLRYMLSCVAAAAVPWIYLLSWMYVFPDSLSPDLLRDFRMSLAFHIPSVAEFTLPEIIVSCFALLLTLRALVFVSVKNRERNKAQKNAFGLSVALSVVSVLTVVFCSGSLSRLVVMVAAVPVSFAVFDLFTNGRRQEVCIWLVLLILLAASFRILEFFPSIQVR